MNAPGPDKVKAMPITQAIDTLKFLHPDAGVFEICIISPAQSISPLWEGKAFGKKRIVAGWFRDWAAAAKLAMQIKAEGIYTTLNPCQEALLARADHRLKSNIDRTGDHHITGIRNILIDIDPIRPTGISSTDEEHEAALEMVQVIKADLAKEKWPDPLVGDSGNGAHLNYPVDLPNVLESVALVKGILEALALRYADELKRRNLEIDLKVYNPSRLTKLYGTMVRKGDNTQDRPHRKAKIISLPEIRRPVPVELLKKLVATTAPAAASQAKEPEPEGRFDPEAYLAHYDQEVVQVKPHKGGQLFCLAACVFNSDHNGNEAAIGQTQDGKLYYQCFHKSCKGRTWAEARAKISGADKLDRFMVGGCSRTTPTPKPPAPDYDQAERAAIQAEARHARASISRVFYEHLSPKVEKALKEGGLTGDEITYVLNSIKKPDQSIPLAQRVREWALVTSGYFLVTDCYTDLHLVTGSDKNTARQALLRMEKEARLEKCGDKRGCYRLVDTTAEELRWWEADTANIVPLELPFDLHKQVTIFHKTVIIVAGVTDSGKTAYLLNAALRNRNKLKVNYFSLEMPEQELKKRLERFKEVGLIENMDEWRKVTFKERANNFHQVIKPDEVNIIDYLEITKEFWQVADQISEIYNKLNKGVAIIALQKKQGQEYGLGGHFSAFRSRLYIAMDKNELRVVKAKNWNDLVSENPTNKIYGYKLVKGAKFIPREK